MFNFTGASRPRRNINLSGRKTTIPATGNLWNKSSTSSSLQAAREERAAREAERRRLKAAAAIQRTWRGRKAAERQRKEWRAAWDRMAGGEFRGDDIPSVVSLFLGFTEMGRQKRQAMWDEDNLARLGGGVAIVSRWVREDPLGQMQDLDRTTALRGRFARLLVDAVDSSIVPDDILEQTYRLLSLFGEQYPIIIGEHYYSALSKATVARRPVCTELVEAVVSPLQARGAAVDGAFKAFTARYLTTPDLVSLLGEECTGKLVAGVNIQRLSNSFSPGMDKLEIDQKLWLLAHVVYLSTHGKRVIDLTDETPLTFSAEKEQYLGFLSRLLSSVAVEVGQRIDIEDISMDDEDDSEDGGTFSIRRRKTQKEPLPPFVKEQIQSLVQQRSISSLLVSTRSTDGNVQVLAAFALTLLLVFPARRTDMRFWLCVANTADDVPAVKYVWSAVKRCTLFDIIKADANNAVNKLKYPPKINGMSAQDVEDQWNLVFLFLEMYSFILVTADDHEFLQGRGRQLPLDEVKELTVFLKNLSFAMYWWIGEIMGEDKTKDNGGEVFFQTPETGRAWELGYFRNVVTDVLKALYTRDSRRHFLPTDHWLMKKYLTLDGFIAAVVAEEENRQQHLDGEDSDEDEDSTDHEVRAAMDATTRRHFDLARRDKTRRKRQRQVYLAAIGPRSEIIQNLPFMIPFEKRVEIFREFVNRDQVKRRNGNVDPDQWRFSVSQGHAEGHDRLSKHHAVIRRNHEFEDAYRYFWKLGDGLKEPIQITFLDKWGAEEAGIDGGGVTKEFLTGVCGEAFSPSADPPDDTNQDLEDEEEAEAEAAAELGVNMFRENPQHLLYPNPTLIEEIKYKQRGTRDWRPHVTDILTRYEFAGRILGKCLYEGILVDLSFAPFFLLRWSQPANASSAGVNDLRDLDAEVYRHLMALMDFEGDVESTFNLDFTITTEIAPGKVETYNLKPDGDSISVTNQNRLEYVHLVSKHRLVKEPAQQTAAFLKGLTNIINPSWLKMFNQSELQTLVGGDMGTPIDVEDLRRNTIYGGLYVVGDDGQEHETVKLFWKVMHRLDDEQRRKVLRFVTSVSRAPLLGFRVLRPKFCIRDAGEDQSRLCSASTCVNLLKLPRYKDAGTLREKLLYSVNSNAGFDLS